MGDSAEFEKLTELETRLARALDRIAGGLAAGGRGGGSDDPAILAEADAARIDAEARVQELDERVAALEARLAEAQESLAEAQTELTEARAVVPKDEGELTDLRAALARAEAAQAEAEAARDEAEAVSATKDAALTALRAEQAEGTGTDGQQIGVLQRRIARLRDERDAAQDTLDEIRESGASEPDARILALRREVRVLQMQMETLTTVLAKNNDGTADADESLRAELQALRSLRAAEAEELTRIVEAIGAEAEVNHA